MVYGVKMSEELRCKKCGQLKPETEFYINKKGTCKSCTYTPKATLSITVWVEDSSSPTQFTGIISYELGEFLKIEDAYDITYIRASKISKIKINKNNGKAKVSAKPLIFKSEPILL